MHPFYRDLAVILTQQNTILKKVADQGLEFSKKLREEQSKRNNDNYNNNNNVIDDDDFLSDSFPQNTTSPSMGNVQPYSQKTLTPISAMKNRSGLKEEDEKEKEKGEKKKIQFNTPIVLNTPIQQKKNVLSKEQGPESLMDDKKESTDKTDKLHTPLQNKQQQETTSTPNMKSDKKKVEEDIGENENEGLSTSTRKRRKKKKGKKTFDDDEY